MASQNLLNEDVLDHGQLIESLENDKSLDKYFSMSMQLVLRKKVEVNQILNAEHQTPLHLAVVHQHFGILDYLLRNKADVNAKDKNGKTPLHLACRNGNYKIAECLLLHGADPM